MNSNLVINIDNVRLARNPEYIPAAGGVSARTRLPVFINGRGYRDNDGNMQPGTSDVVYLVGWNSRQLQAGHRGMADLLTMFGVGDELSCQCRLRSYESRVVDKPSGKFVVDTAGNEIKVMRNEFVIIPGSIIFGKEAAKKIHGEIMNGLRPEGWDGKLYAKTPQDQAKVAADQAQWKQICAQRNGALYSPGAGTYNNATVKAPGNNAYQAGLPLAGALNNELNQVLVTIDGRACTYDQYIHAGWTDELMRADARFAAFFAGENAAPAPPVGAATPPQSQGAFNA